jgi:hypothetical protein
VVAVLVQLEDYVQSFVDSHVEHGLHKRHVGRFLVFEDSELLLFGESPHDVSIQRGSDEVLDLSGITFEALVLLVEVSELEPPGLVVGEESGGFEFFAGEHELGGEVGLAEDFWVGGEVPR